MSNSLLVLLKAVDYSGTGAWSDESGNGYNASIENGTATKNAAGNGLVLDGSTCWTFPNVGVGPRWTVSVWYKNIASFPASCSILTQLYNGRVGLSISNLNNDASYMGVGYIGSTGPGNMLAAGYYGGTAIQSYLASKQWVNIQGTWDGITLKTYINGSLVGSVNCSAGTSVDNGLAYRIGRRWDNAEFMTGEIGEVRIYNYPLTAAEVLNDYNASYSTFHNLMVLLRGVNYTSGTWLDESGKGFNATLASGTETKNGANNGLVLDGSTSWTFPNVGVGNAWTASVWYKNTGAPTGDGGGDGAAVLTQIYDGSINAMNLIISYLPDSNTLFSGSFLTSGNTFNYGSSFTLTTGAWTNIQLTWDGTNLATYINGSLLGTTQPGHVSLDNGLAYRIGRRWDINAANQYVVGEIGEVRIYNYPLTSAQVTADYNASYATFNKLMVLLRGVNYTSGTWADESGLGFNATLENGTATKNGAGNGLVLDGSTNWTFPNVAVGPRWTASVWYKNTGAQIGTNACILTQINGIMNLMIGYVDSLLGSFYNGYTGWSLGNPITLINGDWTNIQVTWDGTNLSTYINAALLGTTQPGGVSEDSGNAYRIGRRWDDADYMVGEIGEVRIYNYAISQAKVNADYASSYYTFNSAGLPSAPLIHIRPKVTGNTIRFDWQPPTLYGGEAYNYELLSPQDPSSPYTIPSTSRVYIVTSLSSGVQYTYSIKAVNTIGDGPSATYRAVYIGPKPPQLTTAVAIKTGVNSANIINCYNSGLESYYIGWVAATTVGGTGLRNAAQFGQSTITVNNNQYVSNNLDLVNNMYSFKMNYVNDAGYSVPVETNPIGKVQYSLISPSATYPYVGSAFMSVAASSNGQKVVACAKSGGSIWTSTDGGETWTQQTAAGTRGWISVACDASGTYIIAADLSGSLWTSADSGVTWTERTAAGSRTWGVVTMSPNGLYVAAGVTNGYIYTSDDRGVTWTERTGSTVQDWASLAISTDGTTLFAGENNNAQYADAYIYKSTDSGATWATVDIIKGQGASVACSSDGSIMYMAGYSYDMFKSTDTGATWTALSFSGATGVVACSSDGTKVVGVANGYINTSSNSGSSWTQRTEPGSNGTWKVTCDASGATIYAVSNGSSGSMYVWKSTDFGATWASTLISDTLDSVLIANFDSLKCSKNGQYIYLSIAYGYLWSSSDYGATWTQRYSSAIYDGTSLACSDNGSIVYAANIHSISTDYGVTWNSVSVAGSLPCAISSDGTIIAIYPGGGGGMIYISRDTGATWTGYPQTTYTDIQSRGMGMSANGQVVVGTYQKGAYVTADGGTTWYTTPDPGEWSCIRISADKTKVIATNVYGYSAFIYLSLDSGVKWDPLIEAGSYSWSSIAVSADFTKMTATRKNNSYYGAGSIYYSTDSGATWTLGQFSAGHDWSSVTGDSTGQYLTAVENGGYIWRSRDFGASWYHYESLAPYSFSAGAAFKSIATSSDGTGIIAVAANQSLWRWNNSIQLWKQVAATPSGNWSSVSICYYNSALILAADISGYLWRSSDAGLTWTQLTAAGSRDWSVVMISNGSIAAAAVRNGYVYTSADGGLTWTERTGSGIRYWASLTISDDGTTLYAGESITVEYQNGAIWKSTDSGATWAAVDNGLTPYFGPSAFSTDGTKMYSGLYFSSDLGKTWTNQNNYGTLGNLSSLACSPNGSFLVAANGGSVFTSSNSGVDWTSVFTPTGYSNVSAACDASGENIYTIGQDSNGIYIWTSNNFGSTWSSAAYVSSSLVGYFRTGNFICSKDGKFLYFAINYGYVWGSYDYGATWTEFTTSPPGVGEGRYLSCTDNGETIYTVIGGNGATSSKGVFDGTSAWTWSSITLNGGVALNLTVSGNGSVLTALTDMFYKSTDGGSTWTGYPVIRTGGYGSITISYDGSIILMTIGGRQPFVTVDGGTTWYTDPDPGEWSYIRMSPDKTKVVATNVFGTYYSYIHLSTDSGDTWVPLIEAGSRKWTYISVSSDFTKMAATAKNVGIYYSTDSGATWTLGTNSGSKNWSSISGSASNQYLNAVEDGGTIWTSSDSGATWSAVANPGAATWIGAAISADASVMLAGELVPWVSNNGGTDWRKVPLFSPGSVNTFSSFISPDGSFIAVAINDITTPRNIWTSSDSGYSWTERTTSGARVWTGIAGSSNGVNLVAVAANDYIWVSNDSGVTWTQRATTANWRGAASSSTGQYMATTNYGGYIYTSDDTGVTWTQRATAQDWNSIASDSTGKYLVAGNGTSIWTSADYGVTWVERTAAGTRAWYSVTCSAYGNNIIGGTPGGSLWASSDFGETWAEQTGSTASWYGVASSANARTILAVNDSGNQIAIGRII